MPPTWRTIPSTPRMAGSSSRLSPCSPTGSLDVPLTGPSVRDSPIVIDSPIVPNYSPPSPTINPRTLLGGRLPCAEYYTYCTFGDHGCDGQPGLLQSGTLDVDDFLDLPSHTPFHDASPPIEEISLRVAHIPLNSQVASPVAFPPDKEPSLIVKVEPVDLDSPEPFICPTPPSVSESGDEWAPETPTRPPSKKSKAGSTSAPLKATSKTSKPLRRRSGEKRQSQNRSAQSKYRAKNKTLQGLGWDLQVQVLALVTSTRRKEITLEAAFSKLAMEAKRFQSAVTRTCSMTGGRLADDVAAKLASS